MTGIDDVLDNEYVLAGYIAAHIHHETHSTCRSIAVAITGNGNEFYGARNAHATCEIGEKHKGAFQDTYHHQVIGMRVIGGYLFRQLQNPGLDICFADQYFRYILVHGPIIAGLR